MDSRSSDVLTVGEAADLLRIPRSSIYKLAQEGRIPAQKVGRHWRFHRATLLKWVAGGMNLGPVSFEDKKSDSGSLDFS